MATAAAVAKKRKIESSPERKADKLIRDEELDDLLKALEA